MKNKKKFSYILKRNTNEILFIYNLRKKFVDSKKPKNEKEFKLNEMYSNILINMLILKCRYKDKTENYVKSFVKKYVENM
jgi:hypothetical protein